MTPTTLFTSFLVLATTALSAPATTPAALSHLHTRALTTSTECRIWIERKYGATPALPQQPSQTWTDTRVHLVNHHNPNEFFYSTWVNPNDLDNTWRTHNIRGDLRPIDVRILPRPNENSYDFNEIHYSVQYRASPQNMKTAPYCWKETGNYFDGSVVHWTKYQCSFWCSSLWW